MSLRVRAHGWRRQARIAVLAGATWETACWGAGILAATALADRAWSLSRDARLTTAVIWAAGQAWIFWRRLAVPWRKADWPAVFAAVSRRWPESAAQLRSAWELGRSEESAGASLELRREHLVRADRTAAQLPAIVLFAWSPPRAARAAAAASASLFVLAFLFADASSWRRAAGPWRDVNLDSWIVVDPGDSRPQWGSSTIISARVRADVAPAGLREGALRLETRGADGTWKGLEWSGPALWKSDALTAPLSYRVSWRDLTTRVYRLVPIAPPRWARAEAVVRGVKGERRFSLGIDAAILARRGDYVTVQAQPDQLLSEASFRLSDRPETTALRLDGKDYKGGFFARQDASLTFILVSSDNGRDASPPAYALNVAPDLPPTADLLSPLVPMVAAPQDVVKVTYSAHDDSAVTALTLHYRIQGGSESVVALSGTRLPSSDVLADFDWRLAALKAGTRLEFWIEAADDATPPQIGRSQKGLLEIVDAVGEHTATLAARSEAEEAVERAALSAEAARDAGADSAQNAQKLQDLQADWKQAEKSLSEWARRSEEDLRADAGLDAEAAQAADDFSRAGAQGLASAQRALAASDQAGARREESALAAQARETLKNMREGAKTQEVQDFARRMSEAGREGDDISAAAAELAARGSSGTVTPAELEALQRSLDEVETALEELRKAVKELPEMTSDEASGRSAELPLDDARKEAGDLRRALQSGDVAAAAKAAKNLAERLKKLARTLQESGDRASAGRSQRRRAEASRVEKAWRAAVEAQTAAVEAARRVEALRTAELLRRQKTLLGDVRADLKRDLSSAAAAGFESFLVNSDSALQSGDAESAVKLLRSGAAALNKKPGEAGAELGRNFSSLADRLERGASAPAADSAQSRTAADAQAAALGSARSLSSQVSEEARASKTANDAVRLEEQGEKYLRADDSAEGLSRAEAALALLQQGDADAQSQADSSGDEPGEGERRKGGGSSSMTVRRGRAGGTTGVSVERVKLPSAEDYRPPKELRDELRKSLSEPRPAASDAAVKEYLKRLAR